MFISIAKLSLLALPLAARSVLGAACSRKYTVAAGDICLGISRSQSVSTYQLAAVNAGVIDANCENLQEGQEICLGTEGEDCSDVYRVEIGDTCNTIATAHNVNTTILMENNPNVDADCHNLYEGLILCVAPEVTVPPVPAGFFDNEDNVEWVPVSPQDNAGEDLPDCDDVM